MVVCRVAEVLTRASALQSQEVYIEGAERPIFGRLKPCTLTPTALALLGVDGVPPASDDSHGGVLVAQGAGGVDREQAGKRQLEE